MGSSIVAVAIQRDNSTKRDAAGIRQALVGVSVSVSITISDVLYRTSNYYVLLLVLFVVAE